MFLLFFKKYTIETVKIKNFIIKNDLGIRALKQIIIKKHIKKKSDKKTNSRYSLKKKNLLFFIIKKIPKIETRAIFMLINKLPAIAQTGINNKSKYIILFKLIFFRLKIIVQE